MNGGGAVTLQFQRSPLRAATRTTNLPWNAVVTVNPVVMVSAAGAEAEAAGPPGQQEEGGEELRHILGENAPSKVSEAE